MIGLCSIVETLLACKSSMEKVLKLALELGVFLPEERLLQGDFPLAFLGCSGVGLRDEEFRVSQGGACRSLLLFILPCEHLV